MNWETIFSTGLSSLDVYPVILRFFKKIHLNVQDIQRVMSWLSSANSFRCVIVIAFDMVDMKYC